MALLKRMTDFQQTLKMIDSWEPTEKEKKWIKENIGEPLNEKQIYDMNLRFHLHLTPDEKGEGFKKTKVNKGNTSKSLLPKSLMPLFDESTDLKTKWKLFCKTLWWTKYVRHIEVDESIWDLGEKLLERGVKTRKTPLIDYVESVHQRRIILT